MIRNRKHKERNRATSPASMFRLHKSRTKSIFLYLCLLQAVATLVLAGYILQYHPWMLEDEPQLDILENENDLKTKKESRENRDGYSDNISHLTQNIQTAEEEWYAVFRFDKFRNGMERNVTGKFMTEAGGFVYFSKDNTYLPDDVPVWVRFNVTYEAGRFEEYGGRVVRMAGVQINPSLGSGKPGGEDVADVLGQAADQEYMALQKGYFMYRTTKPFQYKLPVSLDIHRLAEGLLVEPVRKHQKVKEVNRIERVAIVTIRHDFANFYHSTMNWYDIFLIMVLFKLDRKDVEIIWLDSHPRAAQDEVWETLYGRQIRAGSLNRPVTYKEVIWNGIGSRSQINAHKFDELPFVYEFRHYVLSRYAVPDDHHIDCGSVKVTIIWRRDQLVHPRNPSGFVSRKIENEDDLLNAIKNSSDSLVVSGVQLDELSMKQQLLLISQTDILVGMHGAGLSHVLYLPPTSGVIELYPTYLSPGNAHFRAMAKWHRIPYINWVNKNKLHDSKNHKTRLPVDSVKDMVIKMKTILCEEGKTP